MLKLSCQVFHQCITSNVKIMDFFVFQNSVKMFEFLDQEIFNRSKIIHDKHFSPSYCRDMEKMAFMSKSSLKCQHNCKIFLKQELATRVPNFSNVCMKTFATKENPLGRHSILPSSHVILEFLSSIS